MARIIPKLALRSLKDAELPTYAANKVKKLTNNMPFAAIQPTPAQVASKNTEYRNALSASKNRGKANTEAKNRKRAELHALLTRQADDAALIADGNMALYLSTGYAAKNTKGSRVQELAAPENIKFDDYGKKPNELRPNWRVVKHAKMYMVQVYTDPDKPDTSVVGQDVVSPSKATIADLPGGQMVWVRVRAIGGKVGKGPWSDSAQKRVP